MTAYLELLSVYFLVYALLALSLNLQYGLTGLVNFGQGLFFAVGGYSVAIAATHGWPVWVGIVAGPVFGAATGLVLAGPSTRMRADAWALFALGVASLFLALAQSEDWIAGGTLGTFDITYLGTGQSIAVLAVLVVVVFLAVERIRTSQYGRILRAIREDALVVRTLGRNVLRFQATTLALGGAIGGCAGVVYAHWITFVSPASFSLTQTLYIFAMVIVGGRGNNYSAVLGAFVVEAILVGIRYVPTSALSGQQSSVLQTVVAATALVVILIVRRRGVLPERRSRFHVGG